MGRKFVIFCGAITGIPSDTFFGGLYISGKKVNRDLFTSTKVPDPKQGIDGNN